MTEEEIQEALDYNRGQGFSEAEIRLIQRVAGAVQNGIWGKEAVLAVERWQTSQGIPADGKVYRSPNGNTWPRIQSAARSAPAGEAEFQVGAWIDDQPARVLQDSYAEALQQAGITSVALMVNSSNTRQGDPLWESRWSVQQVSQAAQLLKGIDIILTCWPRPSQSQIDTLCDEMGRRMDAAGAVALEVDAEGNWAAEFLEGFDSLSQAGRTLAEKLRQVLPPRARLELTSYPYHSEFTASATISPHVDVLLPQAYSVYKADDEATRWGAQLGPGNMQDLAIRLAGRVRGPQVVCGLAAYFQDRYPDHGADEAMQTALNAVWSSGVSEIRYWSSKWILGGKKNGYSQAFISQISKKGR